MSQQLNLRLAIFALAVGLAAAALAQPPVLAPIEDLAEDRPEAWLMAHTAMALQGSGRAADQRREPGEFTFDLEVGSLPHLSTEERTVGFGGLKPEDVNRSPAAVRLGATVGIGAGWSVAGSWIPPVELDGTKANIVRLELSRPLIESDRWRLGFSVGGLRGDIDGDFTCTAADVAGGAPGSPGNLFGCEAPSSDEMKLVDFFAEIAAAVRLGTVELNGTIGYHDLDLEFQVDALTFGFRDRTLLRADMGVWNLAVGAQFQPRPDSAITVGIATSPLDVRRTSAQTAQREWTTTVRIGWRQRLGRR